MNWSAYENKNLIVPGHDDFEFKGRKYRKIVLNEELNLVLTSIDSYWKPASEVVTSAIRVPEDSMRIIRGYMVAKRLDKIYPETMVCKIDEKIPGTDQYIWQRGWSALLSSGVIVNPPFPAVCLLDYYRNGVNKKGITIGQSPHIRKKAFDLSGLDSMDIVRKLVADEKIRGFLIERENNCIHCDI